MSDLGKYNVGRQLHAIDESNVAMRLSVGIPVCDPAAPDNPIAWIFEELGRINGIFFECCRSGDDFKRGPGFINHADGQVFPLIRFGGGIVARIIGRSGAHTEYFAGLGIHGQDNRSLWLGFCHNIIQLVFNEMLNGGIEGQG